MTKDRRARQEILRGKVSLADDIRFTLNGRAVDLKVDGHRLLLWVLRTDLDATGTKYGCGEGHCGACTVLVDGEAVLACQTPVKEVAGKAVLTIEGLEADGELHPLQRAFAEHGALQCGYCTPGMIMRAHGLIAGRPRPTEDEVRRGLEGNLCRCGAHKRIVEAVRAAAEELGE